MLYTKLLSFDDVLSLKKTEEVLEIYYGTGQFVNSINYLIEFFDTPYDFYKALGEFYASKSSNGEKHSRISRYHILLEFAQVIVCEMNKARLCDISVVKSLLTYDIYVRENIKTRPSFTVDAAIYKEDIKTLARNNNIDKTSHIEVMESKVIPYISDAEEKTLESNMIFVVFDYENRNPLNHNATVEIYEYNVGE